MHQLLSLTLSYKQEEHREHSSDMCTCMLSVNTHPDQVHFLAALHKVPNFGSHLLPHTTKVPEHTELLEGLIHLQHTQNHSVSFNGFFIYDSDGGGFGDELYLVDNSLCCWSIWGV